MIRPTPTKATERERERERGGGGGGGGRVRAKFRDSQTNCRMDIITNLDTRNGFLDMHQSFPVSRSRSLHHQSDE